LSFAVNINLAKRPNRSPLPTNNMRIRKISQVEFNHVEDSALGREASIEIVDHENPRSIMEQEEEQHVDGLRDSGAGHALSMLFRVLDDKLRSRTNPERGFRELTRRIVALAIRCGGIDRTYEEAAQVLGTSRQSLHLIGVKVAQRLGMPDHSHPGRARAGKAGARAKNAKERALV